jgi:hypothetical protein
MPVNQQKQPAKFHPTLRRSVIATADVKIQQVQVADKKGELRSLIVWQCGPDVVYSNTMDGLFDAAQRRLAPTWLIEQMSSLSSDKKFNYDGTPKSAAPVNHSVPDYLPQSDEDAPAFVQG